MNPTESAAVYLAGSWSQRYRLLAEGGDDEVRGLAGELRRMVADGKQLGELEVALATETEVRGDVMEASAQLGLLRCILEDAADLVFAGHADDAAAEAFAGLASAVDRQPLVDAGLRWRLARLAALMHQRAPDPRLIAQAHDWVTTSLGLLEEDSDAEACELAGAHGTAGSVAAMLWEGRREPDWLEQAVSHARQAVELTAESSDDLPRRLANLGHDLTMRFELLNDRNDLDEAIVISRRAVERSSGDQGELHNRLAVLANALGIRVDATADHGDLDEAIVCARRAVELTRGVSTDFGSALNNLALQLVRRFRMDGTHGDAEEALRLLQQAASAVDDQSSDSRTIAVNLGAVGAVTFGQDGDRSHLDDAVKATKKASDLFGGRDAELAGPRSNLAAHLARRFGAGAEVADLDEAIAVSRRTVSDSAEGPVARAAALNNLAAYLAVRSRVRTSRDDLEESVRVSESAVGMTPDASLNFPGHVSNLGAHLYERYRVTSHRSDLDRAVEAARRAVGASPPASPEHHMYLSNLAAYLQERSRIGGGLADLDEAIATGRDALAATAETSPDLPVCLNNLALHLLRRFRTHRSEDDLDEMQDLLERWSEACDRGHAGRHEVTVSGPLWVRRLAHLGAQGMEHLWWLTALLGKSVLAAATRLSVLEAGADRGRRRTHALDIRQAVDGVASLAAFAHLNNFGDSAGAVDLLESGLTTIAVEQAGRSYYERARLQQPELAERVLVLSRQVETAIDEGEDPDTLWAALHSVRAELESRVGPLAPRRSMDALAAAASRATAAMVWVAATPFGGLVARLHRDGSCSHEILDDLTTDAVLSWHARLHPTEARPESEPRRRADNSLAPFPQAVDSVLNEVEGALGHHLEVRKEQTWVVPVGLLLALPWQARWPHLRLHTSGALHAMAHASASAVSATGVVALVNPSGDWLSGAQLEGSILESLLSAEVLARDTATVASLAGIRNCGVLHVAAHGTKEPALVLADKELRPDDLGDFPDLFGALRLMFANTCLSGSLPATHLDEAAGFATAATMAGTAATLAALWPVHDKTACEFARRFYTELKDCGDLHGSLNHARGATPPFDVDDTSVLAYQLYGH